MAKVIFRIKETIGEMVERVKTSNRDYVAEAASLDGYGYGCLYHGVLQDPSFDSSASVEVWDIGARHIDIKTAWSGFSYTITESREGGCEVEYRGAWKGLMAQNLLPEMTAVWEGAMVESSFSDGPIPIEKYRELREGIDALRKGFK
jgi:hypothetical protein